MTAQELTFTHPGAPLSELAGALPQPPQRLVRPAVLEARLLPSGGRAFARNAEVWVRACWRASEMQVTLSGAAGEFDLTMIQQQPKRLPPRDNDWMLRQLTLVDYGCWWRSEPLAHGRQVTVRGLLANEHVIRVRSCSVSTSTALKSEPSEREFTVRYWG
jgi:hypothetical protein